MSQTRRQEQQRLARILDGLLLLENDAGALARAARNYFEFLSQVTGLDSDSKAPEDTLETSLPNGKAISPADAARCVLDQARTSCFLRGIYAAILAIRQRFPNEKLEILYAGCGPFAALAVPLCSRFSSAEICFTLIDIHAKSVKSAKRLFRKLGFEDYLGEIIQTDAALYEPPDGRKFHLIATETMQKALEKEPQVAITLNLARHLKEGGVFVPEKISVEACLADVSREFSINGNLDSRGSRINLGPIIELSAATKVIEPVTVEIPQGDISRLNLLLLTKVTVFEPFKLDDYDSGITYATVLWNLPEIESGCRIEFAYQTGKKPHFEYRVV